MNENAMKNACAEFLQPFPELSDCAGELSGILVRFGVHQEEILRAKEDLPRHFGIHTEGIRRLAAEYLQEFLEVFRRTDKRLIYTTNPTPLYAMILLQKAGRENCRVMTPEFVVQIVLRGILNWRGEFPSGFSQRCGLNRLRMELIESGRIQTPDLFWNWGLLCDESRHTGRLLWEAHPELPVLTVRRSLRTVLSEEFRELSRGIEQMLSQLQSLLKFSFDSSSQQVSYQLWGQVVCLIEAITQMNHQNGDQLLNGNDLTLIQGVMLTAFRNWDSVVEILSRLRAELTQIQSSLRLKDSPPRYPVLYCYYVPITMPEVAAGFARHQIILTGNTAFLSCRSGRFLSETPAQRIAGMWMESLVGRGHEQEAAEVANQIRKFHCEGYLTGTFQGDPVLGRHQNEIAGQIRQLTGKPVFQLGYDLWNSNREETIRKQVDAIAESMKQNTNQ